MSSSSTSIPDLNKVYLIVIWVETALWGANCVILIFAATCWVLFCRPRSESATWILASTSTMLFLMATAHIGLSLRQLLEALIFVPQSLVPSYATLYFSDFAEPLAVAKTLLCDTVVLVTDVVLIWRLYVVWDRRWAICVFPSIVAIVHTVVAYVATALSLVPDVAQIAVPVIRMGPAGWILEFATNVSTTGLIVGRLWYVGRTFSAVLTSVYTSPRPNPYIVPIFTIIESGAVYALLVIIWLILFERNVSIARGLAVLDISTQAAAMLPLLIIVRVGLGITHGSFRSGRSTDESEVIPSLAFRVGTLSSGREIDNVVTAGRTPTPVSSTLFPQSLRLSSDDKEKSYGSTETIQEA